MYSIFFYLSLEPIRIRDSSERYLYTDSHKRVAPDVNHFKSQFHTSNANWTYNDATFRLMQQSSTSTYFEIKYDRLVFPNVTFGFANDSFFAYNQSSATMACLTVAESIPTIIGPIAFPDTQLSGCPTGTFKVLKGKYL